MKLPELPKPAKGVHTVIGEMFTANQMFQFQHDTAEAILETVYRQSNAYGKTGECMWIGVKAAVRHEQKGLK